MIQNRTILLPLLALGACALIAIASCASNRGDRVCVQLCDGETSVDVASAPQTRGEGAAVAAALMSEWQRKNPGRAWETQGPAPDQEALDQQRFQLLAPFDNRVLLGEGQKEGHPYRDFVERDIVLWERETRGLVLEGARVFHDATRLGSTIAVSCDMCHPDGSNTHPETYPKYQTQIGKTVLLRHMINWCIEHPVRGTKMAEDDPRMIAMEAYILAQRKGKVLEFGKH